MFCPKCGSENLNTARFCRNCGKQMPVRGQVVAPGFQQGGGFVGQILDQKYRIDAKLGSGGMGDVYRARRLMLDDTVAVKILHPHLARDPQAAERFRREAIMATKLRHRNVVGIYDVGLSATHGVPYILMELAEGYTLRQIISEHRILPLDFAVTVTTQVCAALEEAHNLGIVHRDIKPENVIANETTNGWSIKVLDFGIAKLNNQADIGLTQDGNAMGTPQYMSPEQCLGENLDARSDVYSVGIMLYEMLTGTVPFKSPTASAIAIHHVQTQPQPPRAFNNQIHPDVEAVILKSLAKQPQARQQRASELSREFIAAATSAFRSGFTAVPAAPIPAPEAEPEFTAIGEEEKGSEVESAFKTTPAADVPPDDAYERAAVTEVLPQFATQLAETADATAEEIEPDSPGTPGFDETQLIPLPTEDLPVAKTVEEPEPTLPPTADEPAPKPPEDSQAILPPTTDLPPAEEDFDPFATIRPPTKREILAKTAVAGSGSVAEVSPVVAERDDVPPQKIETGEIDPETLISAKIESSQPISAPENDDLSDVFADAELMLDEILVDHRKPPTPPTPEPPSLPPEVVEPDVGFETVISAGRVNIPMPPETPASRDVPEARVPFAVVPDAATNTPVESPELFSAVAPKKAGRSYMVPVLLGVAALLLLGVAAAGVVAWAVFWRDSGPVANTATPNTNGDTKPNTPAVPEGMALVSGGKFMMGSDKGDKYSRPAHEVTVRPFYMDTTEVTNEAYAKFVAATSHKPPPDWKNGTFPEGKAKFPVVGVNWEDANAYAKWAGKRLPTEEEWEFAARGADNRMYPWGEKWDRKMANAGPASGLREVGQGGQSPFGMYDLAGNAWEWTSTDAKAYPGGKEFVGILPNAKVIRGGFWGSKPEVASGVGRRAYGATGEPEGYSNSSFRCVTDLADSK